MDYTFSINVQLARRCADALVEQHNARAKDGVADSCLIYSFRELYKDLGRLGFQFLIADAIRPVNKHNVPLFLDEDGKPVESN